MKKAYVLVIADIHVGGMRTLFPPNYPVKVGPNDEDRQVWPLTIGQKYLYWCFRQMIRKLPPRFILIINGDPIQGHRDILATRLCCPDVIDQAYACAHLLKPLVERSTDIYMTYGTKFHNLAYANAEYVLANEIGADYSYKQDIGVLNKTLNVVHGHSTVQDYPSTPLDKEIIQGTVKAAIKQAPHADIIIRAHVHPDSWSPVKRYGKVAFFCPSWMVPDEYLLSLIHISEPTRPY